MESAKNELISLVIPVYNVEKYLARCMTCVFAQTYSPLEIILVDDGSTDTCPSLCDGFAARDGRVRVAHQQNGGLSAARNTGIGLAKGRYIAFIDSDDMVSPLYVETLHRAIVQYGADISQCKMRIFHREDELSQAVLSDEVRVYDKRGFFEDIFFAEKGVCEVTWTKLYKRELFDGTLFPVGKLHEDAFTTYRLVDKAEKIAYAQSELYYYYYNDSGIMHSKIKAGRLDDLEAHTLSLAYFQKNGYTKAVKGAADWMLGYLLFLLKQDKTRFADYRDFSIRLKKCYRPVRKALLKSGALRADWRIVVFLSGMNIKLLKTYRAFLDWLYHKTKG